MKTKNLILLTLALMFSAPLVHAQQPHWMIGILSSHFVNESSDHRLSDANNPFGTGALVGYQWNQNFAVALTGEYFDRSMERTAGSEKMFRTHLSLIGFPYQINNLRFYTSAGVVLTNTSKEIASVTEKRGDLQARFGVGADYTIYRNIGVNIDAGLYTDGWNLQGWSNSIGFRYALPY